MKNDFIKRLKTFRPPLILSVTGAVVFSALSICDIATNWFNAFPKVLSYIFYVCAAIFLSLAVWAIVLFLIKASPKQQFLEVAGQNDFTARLTQDFSYRTKITASISLIFNILLTASKLFTGWYYSSAWLMVLSGYYIILCLSKFLLLRYDRKQTKLKNKTAVIIHEWKAYRLCGIMFLVLTTFLQGVVIMIVRDGMGFSYHEIIVISMAAYDFYCLISAAVYMIKQRKKHSPIVNSLKSVSFAASLVAMLSLQTAMFSAFGAGETAFFKPLMNILTGTAVCIFLIVLGILMIAKSNKELTALSDKKMEE